MACVSDENLLDGLMDDVEDDEDWTSTDWADPLTSPAHQTGHSDIKTSTLALGSGAETLAYLKTGQNTVEQKNDSTVVQRMLLNDNKAGMEGLDKERINHILHEASKGSKFYENERQKEEQMKRRIEEQRQKIKQISAEQLRQGTAEADGLLEDFEQQRDLSRTVIHIDMDAFYAAVEMRDDPSLKNKPMAVGGNSMLSTSNYHARKFGVRAAMPGFIGRKLCPELVIVPTNFEKYTAVSKQVKAILSEYDPNFCPMSLDEAYLDLTEHLQNRKDMTIDERTLICRDAKYTDSRAHCKCDLNEISRNYGNQAEIKDGSNSSEFFSKSEHYDSVPNNDSSLDGAVFLENGDSKKVTCPVCKKEFPPFKHVTYGVGDEDAVNELRMRIEQKTTLTASAGIAPNMMLAKVCSDKNKPNGQYKINPTREDVMNFIRDLPTRKISGIGKVSEAMLNAVGVYTCTDLYEKRGLLYHLYSQISFNYFMRICIGIGSTTVERDSERKSMSTERTFSELKKPSDLYQKCEELCASLAEDLKSEQLKGKTVSIKIKTVKFDVRTRAHTLRDYTNDYDDIVRSATELLRVEIQQCAPQPLRLRLMGVRMSNLLHERLCHGKKQNTIIGAFKRLAKSSLKIEPKSETSGDADISNMDNNVAKLLDNSAKELRSNIDVTEAEIEPVNVNQSMDWKLASDVLDDNVPDKNIPAKDMPLAAALDELELENSENGTNSLEDVNDVLIIQQGENTDSKPHLALTEEPLLKHADVNKAKHIGGKEDYKKSTELKDIDEKDTSDKDANTSNILHNNVTITEVNVHVVSKKSAFVKDVNVMTGNSASENEVIVSEIEVNIVPGHSAFEKEVKAVKGNFALEKEITIVTGITASKKEFDIISENTVSEKEVNIISENTVSEKEDNVVSENSASEKEVDVIQSHSASPNKESPSVFSPVLRTTRSGLKRTPVSQLKRKNKRSRKKGKQDVAVTYSCPVCALNILCENLQTFNEHVDMCLESGEFDKASGTGVDTSNVEHERNLGKEKDDISVEYDKRNLGKETDTISNGMVGRSDETGKTNFTKVKSCDANSGTAVTRKTPLNHVGNSEKVEAYTEFQGVKNSTTEEPNIEYGKISGKLNKDTEGDFTESNIDTCAVHEESLSIRNTENSSTEDLDINEANENISKSNTYDNDEDKIQAELESKVGCKNNADRDIECSSEEFNKLDVCDKVDTGTSNDIDDINVNVEAETVQKIQPVVTLIKHLDAVKEGELKAGESCAITDNESKGKEEKGCYKIIESEEIQSSDTSNLSKLGSKTPPKKEQTLLLGNIETSESEDSLECKDISIPPLPLSPEILIKNGTEIQEAGTSCPKSVLNKEDRTSGIEETAEMDLTGHRELLQRSQVRKREMDFSDEIEELPEDNTSDDTKGDEDSESDGSLLVCPVCNVQQRSADLNDFNSHVDSCLSRGTISKILKEQKQQENGGIKRTHPSTPGSSKSVKRRKTTMPGSTKPCRSIASFFFEK